MVLKFNNSNDVSNNILQLLHLYEIMTGLLSTYFDGFEVANDGKINQQYLVLCTRIEELLNTAGIISDEPWRPFDNLYVLDHDAPELEWEYGGHDICFNFLSQLEELNVKYGKMKPPITKSELDLLKSLYGYLNEYQQYKREDQANFIKKYSKIGNKKEDTHIVPEQKEASIESSVHKIKIVCEKFPEVVKQLNMKRHGEKASLLINDEYDVQYLIRAMLSIYFDDIRAEEPNSSCLGSFTKSDFTVDSNKIIIETKMPSDNHPVLKISKEIKEDLSSYKITDCKKVIFFIYDPNSLVKSKKAYEQDIKKIAGDYAEIYVYP